MERKMQTPTITRFHIKISIYLFILLLHLFYIRNHHYFYYIVMEFNIHYTHTPCRASLLFSFPTLTQHRFELLNWISNIFQFHFWMIFFIPVHNQWVMDHLSSRTARGINMNRKRTIPYKSFAKLQLIIRFASHMGNKITLTAHYQMLMAKSADDYDDE